jgi:hypothetical protein
MFKRVWQAAAERRTKLLFDRLLEDVLYIRAAARDDLS